MNNSFFEHFAANDDSAKIASRKAVAVAAKRFNDRFAGFLNLSSNRDEFDARLDLIRHDVEAAIKDACDEFGAEGSERIATAIIAEAAGGFCDDCRNWKSGPRAGCTCDGDEEAEEAEPKEASRREAAQCKSCGKDVCAGPHPAGTACQFCGSTEGVTAGFLDIDAELADAPSAVGVGDTEEEEPMPIEASSTHQALLPQQPLPGQLPGQVPPNPLDEAAMTGQAVQGVPPQDPAMMDPSMMDPAMMGQMPGGVPPAAGAGPAQGVQPPPLPTPQIPGVPPPQDPLHPLAAAKTGEALKTEKLPKAGPSGLGGPSPKIDKGKSGDESGWDLKPIDAEMSGTPHPTIHQDIDKKPDHTKKNFLDQTDAVTKSETLPSNSGDAGFDGNGVTGDHTDTWSGMDGLTDPVTSAVDPDKNPVREILENEFDGFVPNSQVEAAIGRWNGE